MASVEFGAVSKRSGHGKLKDYSCCLGAQPCSTLCELFWLYPSRLLCPWDSPGKNTEVGCHFLVQGIFPTQGSNQCLLHWLVDSLLLSHLGDLKRLLTSLFSNYIYCEAEFPSHLATKAIYCNRLNTKAGMRIRMNQYEYQQIKLKQKFLCPQLKKTFILYLSMTN